MDFDLNVSFLPSSPDSELNDEDLQAMETTAVPCKEYQKMLWDELNTTQHKFYAEVTA